MSAGREPWASAWAAFRTSDAGINSQPNVSAAVTDVYALQNQGHTAYVLAMKWVASGDMAYATAAKRMLDGWVNTVTSMPGATTLRTGIGANQFANAAEIIAHGFNGAAGWPPAQVQKAKTWFKNVVWPLIGQANAQRSSNWGTSAMAGCMATAIFADDLTKFNYTVNAFKNGFTDAQDGCSGVTQYICEESGQATEAGRDQGHAQGGTAHLVEVAMMAWNQGTNLVTVANNRVVAGMEYLAKYNLNNDVPYNANFADPCNVHPVWTTISPAGRGSFSQVYEMGNKLFNLAAVPHPFTTQVVNSPGYQPEKTNGDHPGLGTLAR
ncbi:MAG: alginate lyase family protein [Deltaproteobacteria bacterium]|nr:alginate lyase family protein [Deltaproteobacteria bacterium]